MMTNLDAMTTDRLLYLSDWIKDRKHLTQRGTDLANQNLIEIDAELESRQPVGEFRTLYQGINHSFSCRMGLDKKHQRCYSEFIGFEYLGNA